MQGQIDIHFQPLSIQSVRPFEIQTLCQNRTPEQVIQFIPLAYSLCGKAQKFAAQLALHTLTQPQQKQIAQQVVIETLKEHYIGMTQLLLCVNVITDEQRTYALQGVGNWGAKHTDSSDLKKTAQQIQETFSTLLPGIHHATTVNDDQAVPTILSLPIMTTLLQQIMPLNMPHELPKLHQQKNIEKYLFDTN
ncbi:MAG: hypothetical protein L3J38_02120, partial [Thiomicrorhabdus sp.]|nr:hypothetical protein [Thiomicrorhabdus sp.]